jgi:NADPH-dependent glutamate synthase beta subunit-like oxidoreductase
MPVDQSNTAPKGLRPLIAEVPDDTSDLHFVPAPCQIACPVGTDAPSYIAHIWDGEFEKAYEAITATNPFSSICGRVCDAPCEPACRRTDSDGTVQIRNLKRFVMDKVGHDYDPPALAVTRKETVGIVGSGPAGMVAAHDLCEAGFEVHLYEMTDRLGGMMIWGIPAFRLPQNIIQEDIDRITQRCPGLIVHLNTALGTDVTLEELKSRHDAVVLAIGSWWGKNMGIPGEDDDRVVDGVQFLREINGGARPEMPETVVVVGGGDVAMDACRAALRLPGCKTVKVIYRRGEEEIPARKIELEGAIEEGIEFAYNTQQVSIEATNSGLNLRCVKTEAGEPDEDGRRRPVVVDGSEHDIACGMVIAAVGQQGLCAELDDKGMMLSDRVRTDWDTMRTDDSKVFAAGDGAFGGSTIVMAMSHGQRVAYYVKAFLEGREEPLPYSTPFRTRRVPVAQDNQWEVLPVQEAVFHGVGEKPIEFPEIEDTYGADEARKEAARCYRCDAETGSTDYAVRHREDIFTMARTNPLDYNKHRMTLKSRLASRSNPFPDERAATLDDLAFLPANLSRLVIDPYREACSTNTELGDGKMELDSPFVVTGFDDAEDDVRRAVANGLAEMKCGYLGVRPIGDDVSWLQLVMPDQIAPSADADALIYAVGHHFQSVDAKRLKPGQVLGLSVSAPEALELAIPYALDNDFDVLLLDATGAIGAPWSELKGEPDLTMLRDAVRILRKHDREEEIDLVYFGGARSGTDAAKIIGLGAKAIVYSVIVGLAAGGQITESHEMAFSGDRTSEERADGVAAILKACANEASMMARCTGKTNLMNIEPEDIRAISVATATATNIPMAGRH